MNKEHVIFPAEKSIPTRDGFGEGLVEVGRLNPNVVALSADLTESTRVHWFKEQFPERFVQMGVAEQNLATVASGMASVGKIPFIASYATFSPGRNWEQIRTTICYNNMPVKIVGAHAGISVGPDGATHQALEDIAIMRALPNMTVLVPCDYVEARKATIAAVDWPGPVYIRLGREKTSVFTTPETPFEIGRAEVFRQGTDVTIIGTGFLVYEALKAADTLQAANVSVEVINVATVKPLDEDTILTSLKKTGCMVTVEEHQVQGGLGGAVAELSAEKYPVKLRRVGIADRYGQSGNMEELMDEYGLTADDIVKAVKSVLSE
jgi:transketolase